MAARRRRRRRGGSRRRRSYRRRRNPGFGLPMLIGAGLGVLAIEAVHAYATPLGDSIFVRAGIGGGAGAVAGYLLG